MEGHRMDNAVRQALGEIVAYNRESEERDFNEQRTAGEDVSNHIFVALSVVDRYLCWAAPTVEITRDQLECWAGRELSDEEVARLDECIPNSSIPEAIGAIVDGFTEYGATA
jgi:hypothetical protein